MSIRAHVDYVHPRMSLALFGKMATRWGILGAGLISSDFVKALGTLPEQDHQVVAVASRSLDPAADFARQHSIQRHYGSYEELLQDDEVDVVYIGTIHPTHLAVGLKALEAGKPVLCEKPLTLSAAQTLQLIKKARAKKVFLMEATWMRFFPACVALRDKIQSGDIGQVKFVRVNFSFRRPADREKGRLVDPELGGGSVLDVGVYAISLATMLFKGERPIKVHAEGTLLDTGVDDLAVMTLTYSGGRIAQLSCSISFNFECEAHIGGTKGDLKLPHPFWCPTALESPRGVYDFQSVSLQFPLPPLKTNYPNSAGLRYEAQEVRECLNRKVAESDIMPLNESLIVAEIADQVMKQIGVIYT